MSYSSRRKFLSLASAPLLLASCGFAPIYGKGSAADAMYGRIQLGTFDGQTGFDMRERLETRLGAANNPGFTLDVVLKITSKGLAITPDGSITRYNLTGTAEFTVSALDGKVVHKGKVEAFTAYNATGSAYASRVAGQDAHRRIAVNLADKIVTRMALSAKDWIK